LFCKKVYLPLEYLVPHTKKLTRESWFSCKIILGILFCVIWNLLRLLLFVALIIIIFFFHIKDTYAIYARACLWSFPIRPNKSWEKIATFLAYITSRSIESYRLHGTCTANALVRIVFYRKRFWINACTTRPGLNVYLRLGKLKFCNPLHVNTTSNIIFIQTTLKQS
jgi:hypothetical protein